MTSPNVITQVYSASVTGGQDNMFTTDAVTPQRRENNRALVSISCSADPGTTMGELYQEARLSPLAPYATVFSGGSRVELQLSGFAAPNYGLFLNDLFHPADWRLRSQNAHPANTVTMTIHIVF